MGIKFAFATVTSVSPPALVLDGNRMSVPARFLGVDLAVGDRVQAQISAPSKPLVTSGGRLSMAQSGDTLLNFTPGVSTGVTASAAVEFDIADVITANNAGNAYTLSGWTLPVGDPSVWTVTDGGITVNFANYTGGSAMAFAASLATAGVETDTAITLYANGSEVNLQAPCLPFAYQDAMGLVTSGISLTIISEAIQVAVGYVMPFDFSLAVSDPTATASGASYLQVLLAEVVPGSSYVDPDGG